MKEQIKVIAFDADDTLWVNEPYFRETEEKFSQMMADYLPQHSVTKELFKVEIDNLPLYGYGIKGFMLSMIETAIKISDKTIKVDTIEKILEIGQELLQKPIELLDDIEEVLQQLQGKYKLVMATKGDLLDQERKLIKSGLEKYFHHTEIVSEKKEKEYTKLIKHLDIKPEEFLMIGNSLKSDILPVLNLGAHGFHIPFHTTWEYEKIDTEIDHPKFKQLSSVKEVLDHLL
ncbi:HAD family hydrolase [Chondrinema litorale]|uniref:HAD family hydrolase n=1 Tax=Chondrinema litorale TaxID=2994555 RepID=UPI002543BBFE|nr:HAD family hydrolase [Chondrinema litorale]UZR97285.1 HAD family hydrolase [Chondrinema litorale]